MRTFAYFVMPLALLGACKHRSDIAEVKDVTVDQVTTLPSGELQVTSTFLYKTRDERLVCARACTNVISAGGEQLVTSPEGAPPPEGAPRTSCQTLKAAPVGALATPGPTQQHAGRDAEVRHRPDQSGRSKLVNAVKATVARG